ncbi:MAG TPA: DUF6600 domain-containing protein [Burkholderiaceae bacterium]|nr:DUF6600 domain-containing protein [Burkholderiaceae bacterium]
MNVSTLRRPLWALASTLLLTFSGLTFAEPPSRAARLGYITGTVSFSPAGQPDWVRAAINRPLTSGDRLWTGGNARAEVQIGGAAIRMGPSTSLVLLNLDDRIAQVQLTQGTLRVRVRNLGPRQTFEVATPNLAFTLRRAGDYRIEVDPDDDATTVMVRSGQAEVYGQGASYTVDSRRAFRFYGTDLSDYETLSARRDDDLDRWSRERDRRGDRSVSARYVSYEVVGYEDLDAHGSWRVDPTYGNVWTPRRVASGWTPYRDGHWSWVDPWGWTWVDDAPWGYAVSHYGRWAHTSGSWAWVPGPRSERAVYAPALVAFVGGRNFQVSVSAGSATVSNVGWFPLAPREVYQPSYPVSRAYFDNINRSNAVIAPQTITNIYNTTIVNNTTNVTNVTYVNQTVTNAVVAVPTQAFVRSQPVAKATLQLPREALVSAPVVRIASVAPVQQSVQGGAPEAVTRPPAGQKAIVARTAPPPAPVPFAVQQPQLAARPGAPIDETQRTQFKPAAAAVERPKVSVVAAAPAPTATALPPETPPARRSPEARKAAAAGSETVGNERRRSDDGKVEKVQRDAANAEASKAEALRGEAAQADISKAAAAKAEAAKAEAAKAAEAKVDAGKAASAKAEAGKADEAKVKNAERDAAKAEASKAEALRGEAARAEVAKAAAAKAEAAKAEAASTEASKAAAAKAATQAADASKAATAKAAEAKVDAGKAANARSEGGKADEAKAETAKAEKAKAEKAQSDAAKAEASKAEAVKAEAVRADAAKASAARAEAAKADAAKAEAARVEASKLAVARTETAKAEAAKAEAAKAEAAKAEAAKAAAAKADEMRAAPSKAPDVARPPKARASGPKSDAEAADDDKDDKEKKSRKP